MVRFAPLLDFKNSTTTLVASSCQGAGMIAVSLQTCCVVGEDLYLKACRPGTCVQEAGGWVDAAAGSQAESAHRSQ